MHREAATVVDEGLRRPAVEVQPAWASIWLSARPQVPHVVKTTLTGRCGSRRTRACAVRVAVGRVEMAESRGATVATNHAAKVDRERLEPSFEGRPGAPNRVSTLCQTDQPLGGQPPRPGLLGATRAQIHEPVDGADHDRAADDVPDRHRAAGCRRGSSPRSAARGRAAVECRDERVVGLDQERDRDEVHVRDRVLEAGGDEGGDRRDDREDLVRRRVRAVASATRRGRRARCRACPSAIACPKPRLVFVDGDRERRLPDARRLRTCTARRRT